MSKTVFQLGILALLVSACGGNVVVDGAGGSSSASTSDTSSSSSVSVTSSSTGPGGCTVNSCGPAEVCIFSTGQCAPACSAGGFDPCGPGFVCDVCATSSCPKCNDCVGACLPAVPGTCDDHDDCAPTDVCIYGAGLCAPYCDMSMPGCPTPDLVCNFCATSSCPGCEDCVGACTESF